MGMRGTRGMGDCGRCNDGSAAVWKAVWWFGGVYISCVDGLLVPGLVADGWKWKAVWSGLSQIYVIVWC